MKRLLSIGLILICAMTATAGGDYALRQDLDDGITIYLRSSMISEDFWLGNRDKGEQDAVAAGYARQHVYIADHDGLYVWTHFHVSGDACLVLEQGDRLVFRYEDGREVVSEELVFTDSWIERQVFSTAEQMIVLTADSDVYGRTRRGGYLAAVRFLKGSLGRDGEWGYEVPVSVGIRKGGMGS